MSFDFVAMVRPSFSANESMVGMPFREYGDAVHEGLRYLRAGNYSARVAKLDHEGREIPGYGGFLDYFGDVSPIYPSPFDSLTTPAEIG